MMITLDDTSLVAQLREEITELRAQLMRLRYEISDEVRTRRLVLVDVDGSEHVVDRMAPTP